MKPQKQKPRSENKSYMAAAQQLRRSNAAKPHRNKSRYSRKQKYPNQGWE